MHSPIQLITFHKQSQKILLLNIQPNKIENPISLDAISLITGQAFQKP